MDLPDVNILINAFRPDLSHHELCRTWLEKRINQSSRFGISPLTLSAFVRIVSNPKIFKNPEPTANALAFAEALLNQDNCLPINPEENHWRIFCNLCRKLRIAGSMITDAYFAAIAIEHSCHWVTLDRDFMRFKDLDVEILG